MRGGWAFENFELHRYRHHDEAVFLYAFDLLQLESSDPLEVRKATLESVLFNAGHWHPV